MGQPSGGRDHLGDRCALGSLEHANDLRLLGASADGDGFRSFGFVGHLHRFRLWPRLPRAGDSGGLHRLDADGLQPGLGRDQRGQISVVLWQDLVDPYALNTKHAMFQEYNRF